MNALETRRTFLCNALWVCTAGLSLAATGGALTLLNDANRAQNSRFVPVDIDSQSTYQPQPEPNMRMTVVLTKSRLQSGWYSIFDADGNALTLNGTTLAFETNIDSEDQKWHIIWNDDATLSIGTKQGTFVCANERANGALLTVSKSATSWTPWVDDDGAVSLEINDLSLGKLETSAALRDRSDTALLRFSSTTVTTGWYEVDGDHRCIDPDTCILITNATRVDPTDSDGSVYDFDADGNATWHLPTLADLDSYGPDAPMPTSLEGDMRQRSILCALSRIGCPYEQNVTDGTAFVCDGLTGWAVSTGTNDKIRFLSGVARVYQDMSYQHEYLRMHNGVETDWSKLEPGDIIFWGDSANIENHSTYGSRHVSMYYGTYNGTRYMIHAGSPVQIASMDAEQAGWNDFIDFGDPFGNEGQKSPVHDSLSQISDTKNASASIVTSTEGGWDFSDTAYVSDMKARADYYGSDTDWYVTVDCDEPCRDVVFHRENSSWIAVAGWYAVQGPLTANGGSRSIPGRHKVVHKNEYLSNSSRHYITCYVYALDDAGGDDCQAFHDGFSVGEWGYNTMGCSGLTEEHAKFIFDNIPVGTTVDVCGNATGISEPTERWTRYAEVI